MRQGYGVTIPSLEILSSSLSHILARMAASSELCTSYMLPHISQSGTDSDVCLFSFSTPSMPNPFNITILDTSPIFQYLPSRDGPIDSSWNASFSGSPDSTWVPQSYGVGVRSFLSGGLPFLSSSTSRQVHIGQDLQAPQCAWIGLGLPYICTAKPLLEHILSRSTDLRQAE